MEASSPIPMPQTQGAGDNELADNPEPMLSLRCFGRSVSLPKRTAVFLSAFMPVYVTVSLTAALTAGFAVINNTAGGAAASAAAFAALVSAGVPAGVAAGFAAGAVAERLYIKYRHVTPTFSPAELTQVTGHNPDAIEVRTPLPTDRSGGVTTNTNNEAQSIKDTTPSLTPPESDD